VFHRNCLTNLILRRGFSFWRSWGFYVIGGITATRSSQKSTSQIPVFFIVMVFYNELQNELDKDDIQMRSGNLLPILGDVKKDLILQKKRVKQLN